MERSEIEMMAENLADDLMNSLWDSANDYAFEHLSKEKHREIFYEAVARIIREQI